MQTPISAVVAHNCNRAHKLQAMWKTDEILKQKNQTTDY